MGELVTNIAGSIELAIGAVGLWLLIRLEFLPSAKLYRRPPELAKWAIRPDQFLLYVWCILISVFLCSALTGWLLRLFDVRGDMAAVIGGAALHPGILLGIVAARLFFFRDVVPAPATPPRIPSLLTGSATFLVCLPVVVAAMLLWQGVLNALHFPVDQQEMVDAFSGSSSLAVKLLIAFLAVCVAPVSEELLFRAGLFRYLRGRTPRWVAYLVPALLFAALHVTWNSQTHSLDGLVAVLPLMALAIIFSIAYERTGRISTTIIAHALFNLNELVMTALHVFSK